LPELLRVPVTDAVHTLLAPTPVLDPTTAAVVEQAVAAARAEAYREGEAAGRAAAIAAAERAVAAVTGALDGLQAEAAAQRDAACRADLELAAELATDVLDRTPPDDALVLLDRIRAVVAMLDDDPLEVRLHPDDLAALEPTGGALDGRLRCIPDPAVGPGEARIAGTWGGAALTRRALLDAAAAARAEGRA
jgi:flagellar assembly protein FliH